MNKKMPVEVKKKNYGSRQEGWTMVDGLGVRVYIGKIGRRVI
jgi:hypothetical protein